MGAATTERVVVEIPVVEGDDGEVRYEERYLDEFPAQVELLSPIGALRMPLIPERVIRDPVTGHKEVIEPGVTLVFEHGRKTVDRDLLPFITKHSAFHGKSEKALVFLSDDPRASTAGAHGPLVVSGAMSSTRGIAADGALAPLNGWDSLSPAEIRDALEKGRVADPMGALSYEFRVPNGKRRERVKTLLWQAANGEELAEGERPPVDEIDPDAGSQMPGDARRV